MLVLAATRGASADAAGELTRAETEYREHLLRERPDLATRYGLRAAAARLVPVTEATVGPAGARLAALAGRLAALGDTLAPRDAARRDTLRARIAHERVPYLRDAWRTDPGAYLDIGPRAVLDVATLPRTSPCTRARLAAKRLRTLPEVLRAARVSLDAAPAANAAAVDPWLAAMDSLRALPQRLAGCREPARVADLVEADSLALAAIGRFVRFLREGGGAAEAGTRR